MNKPPACTHDPEAWCDCDQAEREFFVGLGSIFHALHLMSNDVTQSVRKMTRACYVYDMCEGEYNLSRKQIWALLNDSLGDVPDSMGDETIEAAYDALKNRDESSPALIELRRRLGPAQNILDGEDAAQALREMPFSPSRS